MRSDDTYDSCDDTLSVIEAAALLGTSPRTVTRLQADGALEPVYTGTLRNPHARRRYRRADVEALRDRIATSAAS